MAKKTKQFDDLLAPSRILRVEGGLVFIGGELASSDVVETLKSEASAIRRLTLMEILSETIYNEAARYALEEARVTDSAEVRSTKLAIAQALALLNKNLMTNINALAKMK